MTDKLVFVLGNNFLFRHSMKNKKHATNVLQSDHIGHWTGRKATGKTAYRTCSTKYYRYEDRYDSGFGPILSRHWTIISIINVSGQRVQV